MPASASPPALAMLKPATLSLRLRLAPNRQARRLLHVLAKSQSLHASAPAPPPRRIGSARRLLVLLHAPGPRVTCAAGSFCGSSGSKRCIHVPRILLPPLVFTGLLVALWAWKCMMLVVFQNKIIYMPGLPPNARSEQIADYEAWCGGVQWRDERTRAADGTALAMAVAMVQLSEGGRNSHCSSAATQIAADRRTGAGAAAHAYVLYFQGNASSVPPRLPDLSWVLRAVAGNRTHGLPPMSLTFVCLSYRGYWTSRGRPSEDGIRLDAEAGVRWINQHHHEHAHSPDERPILLLWGQSIGSGVATNLAAAPGRLPPGMQVEGMLLETPFLSVRAMLGVLYPQKWLPYKYLWPFLRNQLDTLANLSLIADGARRDQRPPPAVFILEAARDELVPAEHGETLRRRCIELGIDVEKENAEFAYHSEAIARGQGKKLASEAILWLIERSLFSRDARNIKRGVDV